MKSSMRAGLAAILMAAGLTGCGGSGTESSPSQASSEPALVQPASSAEGSTSAAAVAMTSAQSEVREEAGADSLPPDIVVTVADTLVAPGEPIELVVQATPDVKEIALWDGINDRQALVYDSATKVWRASYRVPLRPAWERIGLSVTARNDAHRWRRVWVFLKIQRETPIPADTTEG